MLVCFAGKQVLVVSTITSNKNVTVVISQSYYHIITVYRVLNKVHKIYIDMQETKQFPGFQHEHGPCSQSNSWLQQQGRCLGKPRKQHHLHDELDGLQRNSLQPDSNGLQPASDGLQPTSNALKPISCQSDSNGLQPNGFQPGRNGRKGPESIRNCPFGTETSRMSRTENFHQPNHENRQFSKHNRTGTKYEPEFHPAPRSATFFRGLSGVTEAFAHWRAQTTCHWRGLASGADGAW